MSDWFVGGSGQWPEAGFGYQPIFNFITITYPQATIDYIRIISEVTALALATMAAQAVHETEMLEQSIDPAAVEMAKEAELIQILLDLGGIWTGQEIEGEVAIVWSEVWQVTHSWFEKIVDGIRALAEKFRKLLEIIHFKTILAVHQILMIVSPQYRAMMQRLYASITRLSKALGFGPEFIMLAVHNTRTLVFDAAHTLGLDFDGGRLHWLEDLDRITTGIAKYPKRYKNHPELLFEDLGTWVETARHNAASDTQLTTTESVLSIIGKAGDIAEDVSKVTRDLNKLLLDLPAMLKDHIGAATLRTLQMVGTTLDTDIRPRLSGIDKIIAPFGADIAAAKAAAAAAAARILTPKETVTALAALPIVEQDEVLAGLDALDNRRTADMLLKVTQWSKPVDDEFQRLLQLPTPVKPPPVFLTLEHSLAPVPDLKAPVSGSGPFVGDY